MDPEIHSLTGAYACDALDPAERAAFERHLAMCPVCAQDVAELQETAALLGVAATETPPPWLKASVDAAVGRIRQLPPETAPIREVRAVRAVRDLRTRRRRGFTGVLGWSVAAAMSVIVAVLGVRIVGQQDRIDSTNRTTAAMSALLAAPDARSGTALIRTGGNAMVVVSRSRDEAAISMTGLTVAPPGQAYQLWMIGPDGIRSGGILPTSGTAGSVVAHGLGDAETIGLTLEPAHGSAQPTTTPVLLLPMPA